MQLLFKFLNHGREKEVDESNDADNDKNQDTSTTKERTFLHIYFQYRTTFSDEMSANLLHWIVKEMNEYLDALCVPIKSFVSSLMTSSSTSVSYGAKLMMETSLLLETLSKNKKIGSTHLEHHALDVIILSTQLLNKFSHSSSLHNDIDAKMRMHAYGCIENLVTKYPLCVKDVFFQVADILFKLLDKEVRNI